MNGSGGSFRARRPRFDGVHFSRASFMLAWSLTMAFAAVVRWGDGSGDRHLVHDEPFDPVGDHPRDPKLVVRHLLRVVSNLRHE
jgi:hypothetical protein